MADQSIASLNNVIKSNIYTFVCLSQSGPVDPREAVAVLGLDSEQAKVLNQLGPGQGVIKLAGKFPHALLVDFPFIEPKHVTEKEIDEINANNRALQRILDKIVLLKPARTNVDLEQSATAEENKSEQRADSYANKTKMNLRKLLEEIAKTPFERSTGILRRAGFSGSSGDTIKTFAIEKGYVNEQIINLGTRGALSKYFDITEKGYYFLEEVFVEYPKPKGKGSFEHKLYQDIIAKFYTERAMSIEIESTSEKENSYGLVDVLVTKSDGKHIAHEVEFNINQHVIQNIVKCVEANFLEIIVVTRRDLKEKISHFIESNLDEDLKDKINVKPISEFLNAGQSRLL
jgi:hypothetical protein